MTDFVLVHGAWHGGWCWRHVADMIRDEGHRVFTPTLTGLGSRAHQLHADISLATHVADIVGLLDAEELEDVVLVGHSYGARPTALACAHPAIGRWISLDGVSVQPGASLLAPGTDVAALKATLSPKLLFQPMPPETLGVPVGHPAYAWVKRRMTAMPWQCVVEAMPPLPSRHAQIPKAYVAATVQMAGLDGPSVAAGQARDAGWTLRQIDSGHDLMVTAPEETAATLLALAQ